MNTTKEYDGFDERVGMNIQNLRIKKSLTQLELANMMKVTKATVSRWESGKRSLYFEAAKRLCKVLDCTLEDLSK